MNTPNSHSETHEEKNQDLLDLQSIIFVVLNNKLIVFVSVFVCLSLSVFYALQLPNIYRSEATLIPASKSSGSDLGSLSSQFGGIASLAGINLNAGGGNDKTAVAVETMKSRKFISAFIEKHELQKMIMAVEKWDHSTDKPIFDPTIYDDESNTWVREVSFPKTRVPSSLEVSEKFMDLFNVNYDNESRLIYVSIEYFSPSLAQKWLTTIVSEINDTIMRQEKKESEDSIRFLEEKLSNTQNADSKNFLFAMIQEQVKELMFTEIRTEYVFKTIDPAYLPEEKVKPSRALIVFFGGLIGCFLAIAIIVFRLFYSEIKKQN